MNSKQRKVVQICLIISVVSLVIMIVHSVISHGGFELSNLIPFFSIAVLLFALVNNGKGKNDK